MVKQMTRLASGHEPTPLHELMSRLLTSAPSQTQVPEHLLPVAGTLQSLNQRLERYPLADFVNYTLRGVGQVIFVNNPVSGLLILIALFIQSPWIGAMGLLGVIASTLMAQVLKLDRDTIRNGIFGYNGLLVGVAFATFSNLNVGLGIGGWVIATLLLSAFTTVLMHTIGIWWVKTIKTPPLTLPFIIATFIGLGVALWVPQLGLELVAVPTATVPSTMTLPRLIAALPIGMGQVFLASKIGSGLLIVLAVAICTPIGAVVGLLGCALGVWAGLLLGIPPDTLYFGLWGYNAVLCAMAIGGIFYAPNRQSVMIGAIAAFLSALLGGALAIGLSPIGLPELTLSFCIVTIGCFILLRRSLPSLVPVALHAITSPEEHRQRYWAARRIIRHFRLQLAGAIAGQRHCTLFNRTPESIKGDLRYIFNSIDTDQSGTLSFEELFVHLHQSKQVSSESDLAYLFSCLDIDGNGTVEFEEFGELMLRHRRLMANYDDFVTYFLPINANGDDAISLAEMDVAMASVGERRLSPVESGYLRRITRNKPMTWNRFIEMLLVS